MRANARKVATVVAAAGLGLGLVGVGVSASFTDSVTATQNASIGTFGCQTSSTTSGAVVSADKKSVTLTSGPLMNSAAGAAPLAFTVTSTGTIPTKVHVTQIAPAAPFTSRLTAPADVTLNPTTPSFTYDAGLQWPELFLPDQGKSASVTYTATCNEVPAGLADGTVQIVGGVVDVVNVSSWHIDPAGNGGVSSLPVANGDTLWIIGATTGSGLVATAANGKISYHGNVTGTTHYLSLHRLNDQAPGSEHYWFPLT